MKLPSSGATVLDHDVKVVNVVALMFTNMEVEVRLPGSRFPAISTMMRILMPSKGNTSRKKQHSMSLHVPFIRFWAACCFSESLSVPSARTCCFVSSILGLKLFERRESAWHLSTENTCCDNP